MCGDNKLRDGRGVAQAEVEALRADRRNDMGGLADQGDPPRSEMRCGLDHERKDAAAGLDAHPTEDRMRATLDLLSQVLLSDVVVGQG